MELSAVEGQWQSNYADGVDYYIIEDAVISKLCILGEDVEPCFEGSSVKAPNVSKTFTFSGTVSGEIEAKDKDESTEQQQTESAR